LRSWLTEPGYYARITAEGRRGGRRHFFRHRHGYCSTTLGSWSGNYSNSRIRLLFKLRSLYIHPKLTHVFTQETTMWTPFDGKIKNWTRIGSGFSQIIDSSTGSEKKRRILSVSTPELWSYQCQPRNSGPWPPLSHQRCSSHASATATCKQERPKQGERKRPSRRHLKVTSMHMELRAPFGRIDWSDDITNNCLN